MVSKRKTSYADRELLIVKIKEGDPPFLKDDKWARSKGLQENKRCMSRSVRELCKNGEGP